MKSNDNHPGRRIFGNSAGSGNRFSDKDMRAYGRLQTSAMVGGLRLFPRAPSMCATRSGISLALASLVFTSILALSIGAQAADGDKPAANAATPPAERDIAFQLDERAMRAGGIATVAVERDRAGADILLPGTVAIPQQQIRVVSAPAGGLVEEILVPADEPVKAGQPIAKLRSPAIVEAQRQFLAAIADEALSGDRLRRSQLLFEGKALPERDLRVAQTEATQAKSRLDERTQILSLMGMTEAEVDTLREARKIFATVTLTAPIHGTVTVRHVGPGERIEPSAPVFTIAQLDPLWVNIQVPAARLPQITVGADVSLPAHRGASGRIIRLGRTVDAATQSAIAVAEIGSNQGAVRPGLAVTVSVHLASVDGMSEWSVPAPAVVRHGDRSWVFVRSKDGFRARPVQVVSQNARGVSIRAPFEAEDQVAVRGILALLAKLAEADRE
jgi:cobalt-zinc-cadmium efflux system membrane fusion protein